MKKNIYYISWLQVIGPILVVLGHSLNGIENYGAWYIFSKQFIYIFHMPLFFFISGYLLSHNGWLKENTYKEFLSKKALRLLLPYFFWNILMLLPKLMIESFLTESTPTDIFLIFKAFLFPRQNVLGHTWFLAALFIVFVFTPVWKKLLSCRSIQIYCTIFVGVLLYCLPLNSEFLCISDLHKDLLFFMIGIYAGNFSEDVFLKFINKTRCVWIISAIILTYLFLKYYYELSTLRFIPCLCIIIGILSVVTLLKNIDIKRVANYSFGIYILHWPIMLAIRIYLYQILKFNTSVCIAIMSISGWLVPILVIEVLRRILPQKFYKPFRYLMGV